MIKIDQWKEKSAPLKTRIAVSNYWPISIQWSMQYHYHLLIKAGVPDKAP